MRLYVHSRLHALHRFDVTTVYQKSFRERDSDIFKKSRHKKAQKQIY